MTEISNVSLARPSRPIHGSRVNFPAMEHPLPPFDEMIAAFLGRDERYDGVFYTGVKTTGIFCRPSCSARKPHRRNVEFFRTPQEALVAGYRACMRCQPLVPAGKAPEHIARLLEEVERDASSRIMDQELAARGLDPGSVRRWFRTHMGMTFQAYQRSRRVGNGLRKIAQGDEIVQAAYDSGFESLSGFNDAVRRIAGSAPSRVRSREIVQLSRILTPLGPMLAGVRDEGVCLLEFTDRRMLETQLKRLSRILGAVFVQGRLPLTDRLEEELDAYFAGELRDFSVPLVLRGSPFQQEVWKCLQTIPFGETRSYAAQANLIGRPDAVRAVARANGDNRIAIIIPCHRVVGSDGSLTGYGGGLWRKRWLLDHERGQASLF